MARRRESIWTPRLLRELEKAFKKLTPKELVDRFGHPYEDLLTAHEFAVQHRRLKISQEVVKERRGRYVRRYTITVYAPGFARGITTNPLEPDNEE